MRKSLLKQTVLTMLTGPFGLCYVSVNAALLLTLATLLSILLFSDYSLYLLIASFPVAVLSGAALIHFHNRKVAVRDFTLSTYVGKVSCKVISSAAFKRDYQKPLVKARLKKKVVSHLHTALGVLCIFVAGLVAAPGLMRQLAVNTQESANAKTNPEVANDNTQNMQLPDIGKWIVNGSDDDFVSASLKANNYLLSNDIAYRPVLTLSCRANKTTLTFESSEILGTENTEVTLSFANQVRQQSSWITTSDYQAALAPNPIKIARQFNANSYVDLEFSPFASATQKKVRFDLGNSRKTVSRIRKSCSW